MVNGWIWEGGLADRLKGAVSIYDWCVRNNKKFKLHFVEPFALSAYLMPNEVDWIIDEKDLLFNQEMVNIQQFVCDTTFLRALKANTDIKRRIKTWEDKYLNSNKPQTHVYTNLLHVENEYHTMFSQLFKPSARLQTEIDHHTVALGSDYISISFRFATLLGDFEDCTGKPLPKEERQQLINRCIVAIQEVRCYSGWNGMILVTADSSTFLEQVRKLPNVYIIPGKIGHIDYHHSNDVNMKTFLDFWLISQAKKVFQVRKQPMYGGEFSKTAAFAGGKSYELIEI